FLFKQGRRRVEGRDNPMLGQRGKQLGTPLAVLPLALALVLALRLAVWLAVPVLGDHLVASVVVPLAIPKLEELLEHGIDRLAFLGRASAGQPVHLVGGDRGLGGVVAIQQQRVRAVLEDAQVGGVLGVVAQVALVVVHRKSSIAGRAA